MKNLPVKIEKILCPTDLSPRSQLALGFAANLASRLSARLTAIHCTANTWLGSHGHLSETDIGEIKRTIDLGARRGLPHFHDELELESLIIDGTSEPEKDIVLAAEEINADLIIMKARPSVFSALHFGSIVERVATRAPCPVLVLPSRFLEIWDDEICHFSFEEILFDYDFSDATHKLLPLAVGLTEGFHANMHLLSVLEPPPAPVEAEMIHSGISRNTLQSATSEKLNRLISTSGTTALHEPAVVEWGTHADTVLKFAAKHEIDLICTTLMPPQYYLDKIYCAYLGRLLSKARCPILLTRLR